MLMVLGSNFMDTGNLCKGTRTEKNVIKNSKIIKKQYLLLHFFSASSLLPPPKAKKCSSADSPLTSASGLQMLLLG